MKDTVIFGAGELGQSAISFLEGQWRILSVLDNDEKKWESCLGKYVIKSPGMLENYDGVVIIAVSARYNIGITKQILEMGVHQDKIYYYCRYREDRIYRYELCPYDAERLEETGQPLIQYDLLHEDENETSHKKVLVSCSFYSTYTKQLIENMSKRYKDIEFSLLTAAEECKEKIVAEQLKHIYCYHSKSELKSILAQLPVYDAMQMLWLEKDWVYFYKLIRKKTKRLNLNVGGSDFYRTGNEERELRKRLIAEADRVTAETEGTVNEFTTYYEEESGRKTSVLPFGIEVLEYIKKSCNNSKNVWKEKYHIPTDKIVVTCGHNANAAHQHIKMIEMLEQLPEDIIRQIVCVFPMTYLQAQAGYIDSVEKKLGETVLNYVILKKYMDFQSMAEYALISDIMIHVQTTDQLSSTMLEEMYAGSIVIAGSWLPYQSLHDMGMYFLDVDTIPEVTTVLGDVVANIESYKEKCRGNSEIVWKHSSWDVLAPKWRALWD